MQVEQLGSNWHLDRDSGTVSGKLTFFFQQLQSFLLAKNIFLHSFIFYLCVSLHYELHFGSNNIAKSFSQYVFFNLGIQSVLLSKDIIFF